MEASLIPRTYTELVNLQYNASDSYTAYLNCPFPVYKIVVQSYPENIAGDTQDGVPRFIRSDLVGNRIIAVAPCVDTVNNSVPTTPIIYTFQEPKQVQSSYRFESIIGNGNGSNITGELNLLIRFEGAPFPVLAK